MALQRQSRISVSLKFRRAIQVELRLFVSTIRREGLGWEGDFGKRAEGVHLAGHG